MLLSPRKAPQRVSQDSRKVPDFDALTLAMRFQDSTMPSQLRGGENYGVLLSSVCGFRSAWEMSSVPRRHVRPCASRFWRTPNTSSKPVHIDHSPPPPTQAPACVCHSFASSIGYRLPCSALAHSTSDCSLLLRVIASASSTSATPLPRRPRPAIVHAFTVAIALLEAPCLL
jgi:hypothetical protein